MKREEIEGHLKQIDGWKLIGHAIEKSYKFTNFREAIEFINSVADVAETMNHHPDILLWNWNNVKLTLTTHAAGGLSEDDFLLAARIDKIGMKQKDRKPADR